MVTAVVGEGEILHHKRVVSVYFSDLLNVDSFALSVFLVKNISADGFDKKHHNALKKY